MRLGPFYAMADLVSDGGEDNDDAFNARRKSNDLFGGMIDPYNTVIKPTMALVEAIVQAMARVRRIWHE